jgi:hypothetical protein
LLQGGAGRLQKVFVGLEKHQFRSLKEASKGQNQITDFVLVASLPTQADGR